MRKVLLVVFLIILANYAHSQRIRVVENSRLAKLAAKINKEKKYAVTFGKTIFINCDKEKFFGDAGWVKHELVHVEQYKKYGVFRFLTLYLSYSLFHKYSENPFEKEALAAEYSDNSFTRY